MNFIFIMFFVNSMGAQINTHYSYNQEQIADLKPSYKYLIQNKESYPILGQETSSSNNDATNSDIGVNNIIRNMNENNTHVTREKASEPMQLTDTTGKGNPFVRHIFTADPSAHVFEDKMYVYPSHDKHNAKWYNMSDYHVFSSSDLSEWNDHGVALDVDDVPWAKEYMWAPDCAFKDGWYYLYFPAKDSLGEFRIGVATSQSPSGPFIPEPEPIKGSFSVDPAVFIDDDGQAYMYFGGDGHGGQKTPWVAKLDDTMKEFSGTPQALIGVNYWFEACWVNKINDIYYMSYSTGTYHPDYKSRSTIAYATATNPMGPFTYQGIVNGYVSGWTNHHSIVEYKDQWYFFYHNAEMSGGVSEKRSIAADYLHFNDDGSIREVIQTDWGIGSYNGQSRIEAENYSETGGAMKKECNEGGLMVSLNSGDLIGFNKVDFGKIEVNTINLRIACKRNAGSIEIRSEIGELLGNVMISSTGSLEKWQTFTAQIQSLRGEKDIYLKYIGTDANPIYLNWLKFQKK